MDVLLDTHIILWAITGDPRLPEKAKEMIASSENRIFYTLASVWKVAMSVL